MEKKPEAPTKTHCKRGHEQTQENIKRRNRGGGRITFECRICNREREANRREGVRKEIAKSRPSKVKRRPSTQSILGSTAFGKDCLSRAQIMAFREMN